MGAETEAVLLTKEALPGPRAPERLDAALSAQPACSSLPLIVLRDERGGNPPARQVGPTPSCGAWVPARG